MSKPIDYSKWDAFCDEDTESECFLTNSECHCTQLSCPSQVIIGPRGATMETVSAGPVQVLSDDIHEQNDSMLKSRTQNGASQFSKLTSNGAKEGNSHCWSQTETTVVVSFFAPVETKAKDILSFLIKETESVRGGTPVVRPTLEFSYKKGGEEVVAVSKEFYYPLNMDRDLLEGCWELQTVGNERIISFQFFKKVVAHGVSLWWDRCFCSDIARVDPKTLQGRKGHKSKEFKQVWEEAHELFKQRVAKRKDMS